MKEKMFVIVGVIVLVIVGGILINNQATKYNNLKKKTKVLFEQHQNEITELTLKYKKRNEDLKDAIIILSDKLHHKKQELTATFDCQEQLSKKYSQLKQDFNTYKNQWVVDDTEINRCLESLLFKHCIDMEFFQNSMVRFSISDKKLLIKLLQDE